MIVSRAEESVESVLTFAGVPGEVWVARVVGGVVLVDAGGGGGMESLDVLFVFCKNSEEFCSCASGVPFHARDSGQEGLPIENRRV